MTKSLVLENYSMLPIIFKDVKRKAKTTVKAGQGDKGDQKKK